MGLLNFVEQENATLVPRENIPKPSGVAGFISHQQLRAVQVKEFGHIESKNAFVAEKVAGKFQSQLRLSHAGRPKKEERTERFALRLQSKLPAFQNRAHAGDDMVLSLIRESRCASRPHKFSTRAGLAFMNCSLVSRGRTGAIGGRRSLAGCV